MWRRTGICRATRIDRDLRGVQVKFGAALKSDVDELAAEPARIFCAHSGGPNNGARRIASELSVFISEVDFKLTLPTVRNYNRREE